MDNKTTHSTILSTLEKKLYFSEPNDKPLMNTLLQLNNMKLIEVEWVPGDVRYDREIPFSVNRHLSVKIVDQDVELDFPKINDPFDWMHKSASPHTDFRENWKQPRPLTSTDVWNNACPLCIQTGVWGNVEKHSIDDIDVDSPPVCFVGCQECVKKNNWSWGIVKINDTRMDLPCNGGHSPIDYPVVIHPNERYDIIGRDLLYNTIPDGDHAGGWTGYGCWGQENMNREIVRSSLKQVVIGPTWSFTQEAVINQRTSWGHVFSQVPKRVVDLILQTTGMYKIQSPEKVEIKPGEPDDICIHLESKYCSEIPKSEELESQEAEEHIRNIYHTNGIDTLPLAEEYDEDDYPEEYEDHESVKKRKECASKGLTLLEEIMSGEDKMDEGKYLELCNVFRDIHQN
jgi:hypothetical protein